jgi:hypothetical protein
MRFNLGVEIRGMVNPAVVTQWEQLMAALYEKDARPDLIDNIEDIVFSMRDILLILDGEAD